MSLAEAGDCPHCWHGRVEIILDFFQNVWQAAAGQDAKGTATAEHEDNEDDDGHDKTCPILACALDHRWRWRWRWRRGSYRHRFLCRRRRGCWRELINDWLFL
jgi:hypothetical protein